jgi:hypothetical protein
MKTNLKSNCVAQLERASLSNVSGGDCKERLASILIATFAQLENRLTHSQQTTKLISNRNKTACSSIFGPSLLSAQPHSQLIAPCIISRTDSSKAGIQKTSRLGFVEPGFRPAGVDVEVEVSEALRALSGTQSRQRSSPQINSEDFAWPQQ